jgi:hypothetical protein
MPRRIDVDEWTDFTAGINLRADPFQLGPNESPDLLNVQLNPRGGFQRRRVARPWNDAVVGGSGTAVGSMWSFENNTYKQVVMHVGGTGLVLQSSGGAVTSVNTFATATARARGATFNDINYVQNGTDAPFSYTGAGVGALTQAFSDDIDAPTSGNMPIARYLAVHQGSMWLAYTKEGGTPFPNRVRWSHPGRAQSWRTKDWIDIDPGGDGDEIQAIVPFGDALYVFKKNAIYGVYGVFPDFDIRPIARGIGAINPDAVVANEAGVYFFDWPNGVFFFDGRGINYQFERLKPAIDANTIPKAYSDKITLGWGNRKLWVNVPWGTSTVNVRTLVLDPSLSREGSWTIYAWWHQLATATTRGFGPMLEWAPTAQDSVLLAASNTNRYVVKLEQETTQDNDFTGGTTTPVHGWYQTAWYVPRGTAYKKRFKRPELVIRADTGLFGALQVFKDFNQFQASKEVVFQTDPQGNAMLWDTGIWDTDAWGTGGEVSNRIRRFGALGGGRSVALRLRVPDVARVAPYDVIPDWSINSISFKYYTRKLRS